MVQRRSGTIETFADQTELLRSLYLMERESYAGADREGAASHRRFLAWYLVHGRHSFGTSVVVDRTLTDAITVIDRQGCHDLMRFVARANGLDLDGDRLRAWYYGEAMARHRLAASIGREEMDLLRSPPAAGGAAAAGLDDLSRLQIATRGSGAWNGQFVARLKDIVAGARADRDLPTVSIVGFHRSVLGLGEDARCLFDCLCGIGLCAELVDVSPPSLEKLDGLERYRPFEASRPTGSVVIFCLPAFEMMYTLARLNLTPRAAGQYVIGYWPWETTALPHEWRHVYDAVDEVWASSRFLQEVFAAETDKPVIHVPLHVRVEEPILSGEMRAIFDEAYTFLSVFDFNSRIERKNPDGAIAAFHRAFPRRDEPVQLVLKTLHGDHRPRDLARLTAVAREDGRIIVIDGAVPRAELCGMIARADAYVSLHRAEGFGRPLAEAMLLGTPVIATGWSGCADFLTPETGYPVDSILRPVARHEYPFAAGSWAEPDIDHAARLLRHVYDTRRDPSAQVARARNEIHRTLGLGAVAAVVGRRLDRVRVLLDTPPGTTR